MTAISVSAPFSILTDIDGDPLDAGYVYIGQANLDPAAFPKAAYWDASLTTPAAQPIRTTGGYPVRNGSPARIYTDGDYSIRINNKNGALVYSSPASTDRLDSWQIGYDGGTVQDRLHIHDDMGKYVGDFGSSKTVSNGGVARDADGYYWRYDGSGTVSLATETTSNTDWKCLGFLLKENLTAIQNFGGAAGQDITVPMNRAMRSPYGGVNLGDGVFSYTGALLVERHDFVIRGNGKNKTRLICDRVRFGAKPPDTDLYSLDNLPIFDGTKSYFDESWCSPSTTQYPRYQNVGLSGLTVEANPVAINSYVEFMRCGNATADFELVTTGAVQATNAVQFYYCNNVNIGEIKTFSSSTLLFNMFMFWCFDVKAQTLNLGSASVWGIDIKHGVNVKIDKLISGSGVSFGYGGMNIEAGSVVSNGQFSIQASTEFQWIRNIWIGEAVVNNASGEAGLYFERPRNVKIGRVYSAAKYPLYIFNGTFTVGSSRFATARTQNSALLTYNGNYDTSIAPAGYVYTRYQEAQPWRTLDDVQIDSMVVCVSGTGSAIYSDGVATVASRHSSGLLKRFTNFTPTAVDDASLRTYGSTRISNEPACAVVGLKLKMEILSDSSSTATVFRTAFPFIDSEIEIENHSAAADFGFGWAFAKSKVSLKANDTVARVPLMMCSARNVDFSVDYYGKTDINNSVLKLDTQGVTAEGFEKISVSGVIRFTSTPAGNALISAKLDASLVAAWRARGPVLFNGLQIAIDVGAPDQWTNPLVHHTGTVPSGLTARVGASQIDVATDKGRILEVYNVGYAPQFLGQIVRNSSTGAQYYATSLTSPYWTAM